MVPQYEEQSLQSLIGCYYNHIPEIETGTILGDEVTKNNIMVVIKVIKHFDFDHRRYWRLATVWFDNKPVMVIQNAGREGDDFSKRFITDLELYRQMVQYIHSLVFIECINTDDDVVNPDEEINKLDSFYGNSLNGYFERAWT